jgi:hypothetical protein
VTVTEVLTADGPWPAGTVAGLVVDNSGHLLWTTVDGVLRVHPATGGTAWTTAPPFCHGPALAGADDSLTVLAEGAALRLWDRGGGGRRGSLPGE